MTIRPLVNRFYTPWPFEPPDQPGAAGICFGASKLPDVAASRHAEPFAVQAALARASSRTYSVATSSSTLCQSAWFGRRGLNPVGDASRDFGFGILDFGFECTVRIGRPVKHSEIANPKSQIANGMIRLLLAAFETRGGSAPVCSIGRTAGR